MGQIALAFSYILMLTVLAGAAFKGCRGCADLLLRGFVVQLGVFSVCYYVTVLLLRSRSMNLLSAIYLPIIAVISAYGTYRIIRMRHKVRERLHSVFTMFFENKLYAILAIVAVGYQTLRIGFMEPFALSDNIAYYRVITGMVDSGEIYSVGFTGKYITTSWYVYEAMVARLTGCHGVVVASTVLPSFMTLLGYGALWRFGQTVFANDNNKNLLFIFFSALVTEGMLIIADPAAYMLVWSAWGKNIPPAIVCPMLFALFMECARQKDLKYQTICWMVLYSFIGANATAATIIAIPLQMFALSVIYLVRDKRWKLVMAGAVTILPEVFQFTVYRLFVMGVLPL